MTGVIYFNGAEILSYDHNLNYWGASNNFSNTQVYSIKSRATGAPGVESISGVWANSNRLVQYTLSGLTRIYINNVDIGLGRVSALNFDSSTDVLWKPYTATVEVSLLPGTGMFGTSGAMTHTGNFTGSVGENFITYFTSDTGRYIKDFSYSTSSDRLGSGRYTLSKDCSFSIDDEIEDAYGVTPEVYAKRLMRAIRNSYSSDFFYSSYPSTYPYPSGLSYTTQSFDIVNNKYSFTERYEQEEGLNYTWDYQHSLSFDGNFISIDEAGKIGATKIGATIFDYALSGWNTVRTGIYQRVSGIFNNYTGILYYSGGCGLSPYPFKTSLTKDRCGAFIDYSQSYNNSPFQQSGYTYNYSNTVSYDEDGYITVGENGQYKAFSNDNGSGFANISTAYSGDMSEIASRISGLYVDSTGSYRSCYVTGSINKSYQRETYKEYAAEIEYEHSYSENPNFVSGTDFYSSRATYSNDKPVHLVGYFPITYNNVISQGSDQSTRGNFSNNIEVAAKDDASISSLVSHALSRVMKPSGTDIYASDYSYSFNPLAGNFSLKLDYVYSKYRTKENYLATWL